MKNMAWLLPLALLCCGCIQPEPTRTMVERADGVIVAVKVYLPPRGTGVPTYVLTNRKDVERVIETLETLLLDLKAARDQMAVVEPPPK